MTTITLRQNQRDLSVDITEGIDVWTTPQTSQPSLFRDEFSDAIYRALQHPTDYPPVSGGVVPGDTVAIVIDLEVPQPEFAVVGVLRALEGLDLSGIDVVVSQSASEPTLAAIRDRLPENVVLKVHDGRTRDHLRYLAANDAADPIYLNRYVVDADLVIPISVVRCEDPLLAASVSSAVFPSLADERSQMRARIDAAHLLGTKRRSKEAEDEATRVGWLLGLQWMVQVHLNEDAAPIAVDVGTSETLAIHRVPRSDNASVPAAADVVIACVDGGPQQQSIANLLRAALVAKSHAADEASIVLVSDIDRLGDLPSLSDDWDEELDSAYDAVGDSDGLMSDDQELEPIDKEAVILPAALTEEAHSLRLLHDLVGNADSGHRYLLFSNCSPDEAESFGFGVVPDERSLQRLVNSRKSCVVLRTAQLGARGV